MKAIGSIGGRTVFIHHRIESGERVVILAEEKSNRYAKQIVDVTDLPTERGVMAVIFSAADKMNANFENVCEVGAVMYSIKWDPPAHYRHVREYQPEIEAELVPVYG